MRTLKELGPWPHILSALETHSDKEILRWGRRVGKTTYLATKAAIALEQPDRQVLYVAPQRVHMGIFFDKLLDIYQQLYGRDPRHAKKTYHSITGWSGSEVCCFGINQEGLRGQSTNMLLLDEVAYYEEDRYTRMICPYFYHQSDVEVTWAGTPPKVIPGKKRTNLLDTLCAQYPQWVNWKTFLTRPDMNFDLARRIVEDFDQESIQSELLAL